jgi:hypothetical protein
MYYSTTIGIDTHARKNEVFALDSETGVISTATLGGDYAEVVSGKGHGPSRSHFELGS